MKNAKRKRIMVPMYDFEGQEVWVRLTQLEGNIWYIPERTINQLLDDYDMISFQNPFVDEVIRLPEFVQRVIVLHRDGRYHDIYVDPNMLANMLIFKYVCRVYRDKVTRLPKYMGWAYRITV